MRTINRSESELKSKLTQRTGSTDAPSARGVHPRVNRALQSIRKRLDASGDVSLKTLAAISGLSPSRFMHVFTESMGIPLRPYILSLRLRRACCELSAGASVTSAACSAGFSDAAHLTRTFRRMLGVSPSELFLHRQASPSISAVSKRMTCGSAGSSSQSFRDRPKMEVGRVAHPSVFSSANSRLWVPHSARCSQGA